MAVAVDEAEAVLRSEPRERVNEETSERLLNPARVASTTCP
jgi:hypothetical protein